MREAFLTVAELQTLLGDRINGGHRRVHRNTIRGLVRRGMLPPPQKTTTAAHGGRRFWSYQAVMAAISNW